MIYAIIGAVLFVLLTPGLLLRIPSKGSLLTASIVHAVVFAILFYVIVKLVYQRWSNVESFSNNLCGRTKIIEEQLMKASNQIKELTDGKELEGYPIEIALDTVRKIIENNKCE
jgi:hypothetical protein